MPFAHVRQISNLDVSYINLCGAKRGLYALLQQCRQLVAYTSFKALLTTRHSQSCMQFGIVALLDRWKFQPQQSLINKRLVDIFSSELVSSTHKRISSSNDFLPGKETVKANDLSKCNQDMETSLF